MSIYLIGTNNKEIYRDSAVPGAPVDYWSVMEYFVGSSLVPIIVRAFMHIFIVI